MLYHSFGLALDDKEGPLEELIAKVGKIDSYTAQLLLRETYETMYRIFDHDNPRLTKHRPFGIVAQHPKEDVTNYSLLYRTIYRYSQYDIYQQFGLNVDEFLELPHELTELLFKIAMEKAAKGTTQTNAEIARLEKSLKGEG